MKTKTFFSFLFLFFLVIALGCTGLGGSGNQEDIGPETKEGIIESGNLNGTVFVNGKQTSEVSLVGEQTAEVSLRLRNIGSKEIKNLETKVIGCLNEVNSPDQEPEVPAGRQAFISWTVKAPEMGQGERINCPIVIRTCYDYISDGYVEIPVVNEDYTLEVSQPKVYTRSDVLGMFPSIGILRVIDKDETNTFVGKLIVTNKGQGWVDYPSYSDGLDIYKFKEMELELEGDLTFGSVGGVDTEVMEDETDWINENKTRFKLTANDTEADLDGVEGTESYDYLMKMIQGRELNLFFEINADEEDYQDVTYERMYYTIEHGYCSDIATINVKLSGT